MLEQGGGLHWVGTNETNQRKWGWEAQSTLGPCRSGAPEPTLVPIWVLLGYSISLGQGPGGPR